MRLSTILSSFASSIVTSVIDCVAAAGFAVRGHLYVTHMRERHGYWLELCQPEFASSSDQYGRYLLGNLNPGKHPGLLRFHGISSLAVCPAPSRLTSVRANRQG
jgi:hypothetical protein